MNGNCTLVTRPVPVTTLSFAAILTPMHHDSGYHLLFSHPQLVEDLFKSFVTEPWVEQLDLSTLQRVNAKLHAEGLEHRDGDLIYRVLYRDGSEVYL